VKKQFFALNFIILFCAFLSSDSVSAQLGFCNGNSGDPIFTETFGTGTNYGPPLPAGTTNYDFVSNDGPQDGEYTVGPSTFSYGWNLPSDHTPGDTNGKALIVNASFTSGEFYSTLISGLCGNTTYEFSSWLINILPNSFCSGAGIPVNVQFEIWDITNTNLLANGNTGDIFSTATPSWQQYALVFQTLPGQSAVILKMKNNGVGGCGNDLAIDDIVFKSCGDNISINDTSNNNSITLCSTETPYATTLTVTPDNSVFSSHFYQWEESADGMTWTDIPLETNQSISLSGINMTSYYRTKVAESASNLNNSSCNVTSEVFEILVNSLPPAPTIVCWETATVNNTTCSWDITGTQPAQPTGLECWETATFNNTICSWDITGLQPIQPTLECWETATFNNTTCTWDITGTQPTQPTGLECWETTTFDNISCSWSVTGTQAIQPSTECWETATFNSSTCVWDVTGEQPIIEVISSEGNSIVVNTSNIGDFVYSLDGIIYQSSNIFPNVENGVKTIYVKVNGCNDYVTGEHLHFYIPQFFTPNNDGENDTFDLKGIEYYSSSEVYIYDRFGKILKTNKNSSFSWDGFYNNTPLPSGDYWYVIIIEGQRRLGHFALKR
jgi:gliding motility-associated-like protein